MNIQAAGRALRAARVTGKQGHRADGRAAIALAAVAVVAALLSTATTAALADGAVCNEITVALEAAEGSVSYRVEVADEPTEHARGLMFRTEMAADAGMLFLFSQPRQASFWMRNTFIPLDMIFIDEGGTVLNVAENTVPFSEAPQRSDGLAAAVLEVNAGQAAAHEIGPGTRVRHPFFRDSNCSG
ncbi:MAG: DUF192 domain-containing protein [Pseudomonadota bacterium]